MKISRQTNFLIVGLGVMGGSYAQALTEQGYTVNCITRSRKTIDYALEHGMIAHGTTEVSPELIQRADIIIFALYPDVFIEWIEKNQQLFRPGTLLMDVSGVKGCVVGRVQDILREDVEYIATHPMAGREQNGVEYSDCRVFRGANYIVVPTEKNTRENVETAFELGRILGFTRFSELSAAEHDHMVAFLSQLTHCIAVALMTCTDTDGMDKYTGDSFRDLTRIAKINDEMWSELFLLNKDVLIHEMDTFAAQFFRFRNLLADGDREGMRRIMRQSTERRGLFDKPAGNTK